MTCALSALSTGCLNLNTTGFEAYANYAVPGNRSVPANVSVFLVKTFVGTDLFPGTRLLAYGLQDCWRMVYKRLLAYGLQTQLKYAVE